MQLPTKLRKPPLLEATFEIRFEPSDPAAGDLLPGMLYSQLGKEYPTLETLPIANVPREHRSQDENLRYRATRIMRGQTRVLHLGDHVATLSQVAPYEGWEQMRSRIDSVLRALQETALVQKVLRHSFRCINVIEKAPGEQLSALRASFKISEEVLGEQGFKLRTEFNSDRYVNIVNLATNAEATPRDGQSQRARVGLLVDIDSVHDCADIEFWNNSAKLIDQSHLEVKQTFFRVVTEATIQEFEPEWES